jgi:DNA helicase-2/ATP-dependent DNA helicase PcrA
MIAILKANPETPVALITFTRLSRRTSDRDIRKAVGELSEDIPGTDIPRVATVHTFAKSLVHTYIEESGLEPDFHVLLDDMGEVDLLIREVLADLDVNANVNDVKEMIYTQRDSQELKPAEGVEATTASDVIHAFDEHCKFYNAMDIQSLVPAATRIIEGHASRLSPLYLHVDEYQDLNVADQRLVAALAGDAERQVVAVGDDAQSIYGFRHAHHTGIGQLVQDTGWTHVQFEDALRMSLPVRRASQALLLQSSEAYLSRTPLEARQPQDGKVPVVLFTTADVELNAVVGRIKHLKSHGVGRRGQALTWQDFMILCPSNATVDRFVGALTEQRVPARTKHKTKLTDADKKILLGLRLAGGDDSLALRECLELAGCAPTAILKWRHDARRQGKRLFKHLRDVESEAAGVIQAINTLRRLTESPAGFLGALVAIPGLAVTTDELAVRGLTVEQLGEGPISAGKLKRTLYEELGVLDPGSDIEEADEVLVTTIHSAKGLEAEIVFLVQMNVGLMPQSGKDPEEQRRLLYVAMTRAKKELIISYLARRVRSGDGWQYLKREAASPFVLAIADELEEEEVSAKAVGAWVSNAQT